MSSTSQAEHNHSVGMAYMRAHGAPNAGPLQVALAQLADQPDDVVNANGTGDDHHRREDAMAVLRAAFPHMPDLVEFIWPTMISCSLYGNVAIGVHMSHKWNGMPHWDQAVWVPFLTLEQFKLLSARLSELSVDDGTFGRPINKWGCVIDVLTRCIFDGNGFDPLAKANTRINLAWMLQQDGIANDVDGMHYALRYTMDIGLLHTDDSELAHMVLARMATLDLPNKECLELVISLLYRACLHSASNLRPSRKYDVRVLGMLPFLVPIVARAPTGWYQVVTRLTAYLETLHTPLTSNFRDILTRIAIEAAMDPNFVEKCTVVGADGVMRLRASFFANKESSTNASREFTDLIRSRVDDDRVRTRSIARDANTFARPGAPDYIRNSIQRNAHGIRLQEAQANNETRARMLGEQMQAARAYIARVEAIDAEDNKRRRAEATFGRVSIPRQAELIAYVPPAGESIPTHMCVGPVAIGTEEQNVLARGLSTLGVDILDMINSFNQLSHASDSRAGPNGQLSVNAAKRQLLQNIVDRSTGAALNPLVRKSDTSASSESERRAT